MMRASVPRQAAVPGVCSFWSRPLVRPLTRRVSVAGTQDNGRGPSKNTDGAGDSKGQEPWSLDKLISGQKKRARMDAQKRATKKKEKPSEIQKNWDDLTGRVLYFYYSWRQDTGSDLQLFMIAFMALITSNAYIRNVLVESHPPDSPLEFWNGLYEVLILSFGQQFPDMSANLVHQMFSVVVAFFGLAGFALVLALVEQLVLEMIEANVARGSRVYEDEHVLVLGWATSQRDLEVVWKTLEQLCFAHRNEGGAAVVVMTLRQKLEMEQLFRRAIPESERYGSRFVFRQGNPLISDDLNMVAATRASTTIVVSDASRCPEEADAQSLRCAILLDELVPDKGDDDKTRGHVIIEMKTSNAVPLLRYSCSERFTAVPTAHLNARRLAKMICEPFIATVSQQIMDYRMASCMFVEHVPEVAGLPFGEMAYRFPDAIVMGVYRGKSGQARLNPPIDYKIGKSDDLILLRPTTMHSSHYKPLDTPIEVPSQDEWAQQKREAMGGTITALGPPVRDSAARIYGRNAAAAGAAAITAALSTMNGKPAASGAPGGNGYKQVQRVQAQTMWSGEEWREYSMDDWQGPQTANPTAHPAAGHAASLRSMAPPASPSYSAPAAASRPAQAPTTAPASTAAASGPFPATLAGEGLSAAVPARSEAQLAAAAAALVAADVPGTDASAPSAASSQASMTSMLELSEGYTTGSGWSSGGEDAEPTYSAGPWSKVPSAAEAAAARAAAASPDGGKGAAVDMWATPGLPGSTSASGASAALDMWTEPVDSASYAQALRAEKRASRKGRHRKRRTDLCGTAPGEACVIPESEDEAEQVEGPGSLQNATPIMGGWGATLTSTGTRNPDDESAMTAGGGIWTQGGTPGMIGQPSSLQDQAGGVQDQGAASGRFAASAGSAAASSYNPLEDEDWVELPFMHGAVPTAAGAGSRVRSAMEAAGQMVRGMKGTASSVSNSSSDIAARGFFMVPAEYLVPDDRPKRVLVCGWGEQSFMRAVLRELDQGKMALPDGSEVVFLNLHDTESSLGAAVRVVNPQRVAVSHVIADPLQRMELAQVGVHRFTAAIVLCDEKWVDPDMDASNGVDELRAQDMLRLDSMVMVVQLNVRKLLEDNDRPTINIICQKVAMEGLTRFEDRKRLPLGISVNFTSFAAKLLTQVAYNPRFLAAHTRFGEVTDLKIVDSSALAAVGERVTFWELMARAQAMDWLLVGWYHLPSSLDTPMDVVLNPQGHEARSRPRVWNKGTASHKFVVLQNKPGAVATEGLTSSSSMGTLDEGEEEEDDASAVTPTADMRNKNPARWVRLKQFTASQATLYSVNASILESQHADDSQVPAALTQQSIDYVSPSETAGWEQWHDAENVPGSAAAHSAHTPHISQRSKDGWLYHGTGVGGGDGATSSSMHGSLGGSVDGAAAGGAAAWGNRPGGRGRAAADWLGYNPSSPSPPPPDYSSSAHSGNGSSGALGGAQPGASSHGASTVPPGTPAVLNNITPIDSVHHSPPASHAAAAVPQARGAAGGQHADSLADSEIAAAAAAASAYVKQVQQQQVRQAQGAAVASGDGSMDLPPMSSQDGEAT